MPIISSLVVVTTSPTLLADGTGAGVSDLRPVSVRNDGAADIYLGGEFVATTTGFRVPVGGEYTNDLGPNDKLFAICATGTVSVQVMRFRQ